MAEKKPSPRQKQKSDDQKGKAKKEERCDPDHSGPVGPLTSSLRRLQISLITYRNSIKLVGWLRRALVLYSPADSLPGANSHDRAIFRLTIYRGQAQLYFIKRELIEV